MAQYQLVFSQYIDISSFELEGDSEGSQGASPHFEGRVVVVGAENNFYSMEMSSPLTGSVSSSLDLMESILPWLLSRVRFFLISTSSCSGL